MAFGCRKIKSCHKIDHGKAKKHAPLSKKMISTVVNTKNLIKESNALTPRSLQIRIDPSATIEPKADDN